MPLADHSEKPTIAGSLTPDRTLGEIETAPAEQTLISDVDSPVDPTLAGTLVPGGPIWDQTVGAESFAPDPSASKPTEAHEANRYVVHDEIARGGMGAILRGHDRNLRRELALKVLLEAHQDKPAVVQRFIEEAQISGRLQHPGIVPVYDLGVLPDQRPYFSMKLVHGKTFAALLTERTSVADDQAKCLGIFGQICQTVAFAHNQGIIHRDLKSSNVMVGEFGEVQVMDWGLAKVLGGTLDQAQARFESALADNSGDDDATRFFDGSGGSGTTSHTLAGAVMGTPAYMPPEQARGELERVDERADVFGLGAILCEILTTRPPYVGKSGVETLKLATEGNLEACFERLNGCGADPELILVAKQCLAAEPSERLRHAGIVSERVTGFLESVQHRLREAEVERAAEAARAAEALHTVAETQAKSRAERRARQLQLAMAATVAVVLGIGGIAASFVAVQQNHLKQNALRAEKTAVLAREAESLAKQGAELEMVRAEAEKTRADRMLADMQTSRGLLAAERMDAAQAALWFAHAADQAAQAGDPDRALDNLLRTQNWLRNAVVPVGALSFFDSATSVSFQPGGDLLLVRGVSRTAVWNWRDDTLLPIPALNQRVTAACWSPDGAFLAVAHSGIQDSYVGLGILFDASGESLRITEVIAGSGAADAGLLADDTLETLGGKPVKSPSDLSMLLQSKRAGDAVIVTTTRGGNRRESSLVLKQIPVPKEIRQAAGDAHHVTIWSVPQGELVDEIPTNSPVGALAYSPNQRFLAIANSQVGLWDLDDRGYLPDRWPHPMPVTSLVFTQRGDRLITGCPDNQVRVFGVPGGDDRPAPLFSPIPHVPVIASAPALIDDDQTLLTIAANNQITAWSMTDGMPVPGGQIRTQAQSLTRVVASRDQQWFATGGNYGPEIHTARKPADAGAYLGHTNLVRDFAFHPQGSFLATVSWDQTARFWTVPDGQPDASPLLHTASADTITWSADGTLVATAQGDGLVRVWRRPIRSVLKATVTGLGRRPRLSPDGSLVAPGAWHESPSGLYSLNFRQFRVLRSEDGAPTGMPISVKGELYDTCICTDNRSVACLYLEGVNGKLGVWEIATGQPRFTPVDLPGPGLSIAPRPGSNQLAVLCATGSGVVVDSLTGRTALEFRHEGWVYGAENRVVRIEYSSDGASLVSLGDGFPNSLEVQDAETGQRRFPPIVPGQEFQGRIRSFAISADSRLVASAVNGRNFAQVWDLVTGEARSEPLPHPGDFYGLFSLCFSPDGNRLLTGSKDGEARYWDWQSGKLACPPMSNGDEVNGLAITADGRRAVIAVRGKTHPVQFWDLTTGKRFAPTVNVSAPPTEFLSAVVMTPDGRRALASAQASALAIIDLDLLFQPDSTRREGLQRLAELASGTQMALGDVSRLDRDQWQRRWDEVPHQDRKRLHSEIDSQPQPGSVFEKSPREAADWHLTFGRWRLGAAAALKQIEAEQYYRTCWSRAGACLILAENLAGYRKMCGDMAARFGQTTSKDEADSTCKSCLLFPDCVPIDSLPVKVLMEGLEQQPGDPGFAAWGYGSLGLVAYRRGEWEQSATACLKSHEFNNRKNMSGVMSLIVLAMAEHQLGQTGNARGTLLEATQLIPPELATLGTREFAGKLPVALDLVHHDWLMAEVLRREAALLIFGSAERPLDEATLRQRVDKLLDVGDLESLRILLVESVEYDPSRAWVHGLLGSIYGQLEAYELAVESLRKALELDPGSAYLHATLGMQLAQQGDHEAAQAELRRALEMEPESPMANNYLGQFLLNSGRFEDAVARFDVAIQSDPQNAMLSKLRANALRLQQMEPRLEHYLSRDTIPADNAERCDVIQVCIAKRRYRPAVQFTADALAADTHLADDPTNGYRYNGACCVAKLCVEQAESNSIDEAEQSELVALAIDWLEAERSLIARLLKEAPPADARTLRQMVRHWPNDRDLAGFRDSEIVSRFPEQLQDRLTTFWSDVQAMLLSGD